MRLRCGAAAQALEAGGERGGGGDLERIAGQKRQHGERRARVRAEAWVRAASHTAPQTRITRSPAAALASAMEKPRPLRRHSNEISAAAAG